MSNPIHNAVLKSALAGLMAGAVAACSGTEAPAPDEHADEETTAATKSMDDAEKKYTGNSCAGQNICKGLGGCETDEHACKGLNDCRGKGGCHITGEEQAKLAAKMTEGEAKEPEAH